MTAAHYREQARLALMAGQRAGILPERAALMWRTHDHGLMVFEGGRLEEGLAAELRKLLGHGRQSAPEAAVFPVRLLYALAPAALRGQSLETLPGKGRIVEGRGTRLCLCVDPLTCMEALANLEERGRARVLDHLLDAPGVQEPGPREEDDGNQGSCGQCGGLLGCSACAGSACVRHGG